MRRETLPCDGTECKALVGWLVGMLYLHVVDRVSIILSIVVVVASVLFFVISLVTSASAKIVQFSVFFLYSLRICQAKKRNGREI